VAEEADDLARKELAGDAGDRLHAAEADMDVAQLDEGDLWLAHVATFLR
jgi:hypothetical protein